MTSLVDHKERGLGSSWGEGIVLINESMWASGALLDWSMEVNFCTVYWETNF